MTKVNVIILIGYLVLGPFIGGLLDGLSRVISAKMQRRIGPPLLQPFYDLRKLWHKQIISIITNLQSVLIISYLCLMILAGGIFFAGNDILMSIFVLGTASTFLYLATVITSSPYNTLASSRELIQIMAYEPAVLLAAVGFYLASGSFNVTEIASGPVSMVVYTPGFLVAFLFILTIKMRKSPFDVSTSHHIHQELVKGITTEMGSQNLAIFNLAEWYENTYLLGMTALFFLNKNPWSIPAAIVAVLVAFFLEILLDNTCARMKWQKMFKYSWTVTFVVAGVNLLILMLIY